MSWVSVKPGTGPEHLWDTPGTPSGHPGTPP